MCAAKVKHYASVYSAKEQKLHRGQQQVEERLEQLTAMKPMIEVGATLPQALDFFNGVRLPKEIERLEAAAVNYRKEISGVKAALATATSDNVELKRLLGSKVLSAQPVIQERLFGEGRFVVILR